MPGNFQLGCLQLGEGQEEGDHHRVQHDQPSRVLNRNASLHGDEGVPPDAEPVIRVYHTAFLCPLLIELPLLYVPIEFRYGLQVLEAEVILILILLLLLLLI